MANKLYIGGLSFDTTDEELKTFFQQAGTVQSATVVTDKDSGRSRGFGFVEMSNDAEVRQAVSQLNGKTLGERALRVGEARPPAGGGEEARPPRGAVLLRVEGGRTRECQQLAQRMAGPLPPYASLVSREDRWPFERGLL